MDLRDQLRSAIGDLDAGAIQARTWVDAVRQTSASVAQQSDSIVDAGRLARLACRRYAQAATRNNCVGVFGPSQAGKSYLVSALARPQDGRLAIQMGDRTLDFLREINPPGDRESTGLVTRFTAKAEPTDLAFPVAVRLLTETDIIKILANSFFLDFDPNSMTIAPVEDEDVRAAIAAAAAAPKSDAPAHLDEIALFDLTLYFKANFSSRIGAFERSDYWNAVIAHAGRLSLADRAQLLSPLWGRVDAFTELYVHLAKSLDAVGYAKDAQAALSSLTPREAGSPPEPNTIIDVAVLKRLRTDRDAKDQVPLKPMHDGAALAETSLPRATLTALIAEVSLTMAAQPWPFFEHADLLDFPGARSRLKLLKLPDEPSEQDDQVRELFLRGKIAYLFQRYTDELELTSMLLCMPPSVAEVKDLASMVKGWIAATHGAAPDRRKTVRNALFAVLTKHDLEFMEKGGEDDDSRMGKWDRRLHASLLELYGKDGWLDDWDGKPFDNTYFLRNPGMKQVHLMQYDDEASLRESAPVENAAFQTYRKAFMSSDIVAKHFRDREAVWEAALTPNDGGVAYLVEQLAAALDPDLKLNQARERLVEAAAALAAPLQGLYHAEGDEALQARDDALVALRRNLHGAFQKDGLKDFAHFRRAMMVDTANVRGAFLNVAAMREDELEAKAEPASAPATSDPWDDDPWAADAADAPTEAAAAPTPVARRRGRPEVFAERLLNLWSGRLRRFQQDEHALAALGLDHESAGKVIDELLVGAQRLGLAEAVAEIVREETRSASVRWPDVADRVSEAAAMRFNDFVAYLGFDQSDAAGLPGFPEPPKEASRKIFTRDALPNGVLELGAAPELLARAAFIDWGVALRAFGKANVGHAGGRDITEDQNRQLGAAIQRIEIFQDEA